MKEKRVDFDAELSDFQEVNAFFLIKFWAVLHTIHRLQQKNRR